MQHAVAQDVGYHHESVHQRAGREGVDVDDRTGDALGLGAPVLLLAELVGSLERADGAVVEGGDSPRGEAGDEPFAVGVGLRVRDVHEDGHLGLDLDLASSRVARVLDDVRRHREGVDLVQDLALASGVGVRIGRVGAVKREDVRGGFAGVLGHPRLGHVPGDVPRDAQAEASLTAPSGVEVRGGLHRGDGGETLAKLGEVDLPVAIFVEGAGQFVSRLGAAEGLALREQFFSVNLAVVVGIDRAEYGPFAGMRFLGVNSHGACRGVCRGMIQQRLIPRGVNFFWVSVFWLAARTPRSTRGSTERPRDDTGSRVA